MKKTFLVIALSLVMIAVMAFPAVSFAGSDITVEVNGIQLKMDQPPVIQNGRTLVPFRVIFEALGSDVAWDDVTKTVFADWENNSLTLQIGAKIMQLGDGTTITLDVPATIINSRTLVPVRAVTEAMGAKVDWDNAARKVSVEYRYKVNEGLLVTNEAQFVYTEGSDYHVFFLDGEKVTGHTVYTKCADDAAAKAYCDSTATAGAVKKAVSGNWVVADYPESTYSTYTASELYKNHTPVK